MLWPIKNLEKYFIDHKYMHKIFHDPHKVLLPPSYILSIGPLYDIALADQSIASLEKVK